ncbi:putative amidase [Bradyrhizobium sp. ORS 278]|uniref:amidase n=1 Tax=Bradyrhizobium sp. (strain ORS 278) TaxID=114615 RepID=UPI0001508373|nr:amidase [Bradyrhizobium sp. ORS 278]CAL78142.1 putative amidase [Bradyrhizobium sp. ORS 278]
MVQDPLGAFLPNAIMRRSPHRSGPLSGLSFAVKDLFDVAGDVTGCGNPDWAACHDTPERDAWAVDAMCCAGATLTGKTITDEISLGLLGINRFYGTPLNPRAPDRVPGGSSSGSASAVAGGLVDVALGTDSGGSVRTPASFCGIYGLRPTHGRISVAGLMTQAPSFDTVGYFTRDALTFGRVGSVLLAEPIADGLQPDIVIASDCFALADEPVRAALQPVVARLRSVAPATEAALADGELLAWGRHQRVLQKSEFHATFRDWIDRVNPRFSSEVAGAFADDGRIAPQDLATAEVFRAAASKRLDDVLDGRRMLCLPTTPILPIARDAGLSEMRTAVHRIVDLTCIAGLTGLPQVNLPVATSGAVPVGLSLIGWRGGDASLLAAAQTLAREFSIGLFEEPS